jgi:hypothetical protein
MQFCLLLLTVRYRCGTMTFVEPCIPPVQVKGETKAQIGLNQLKQNKEVVHSLQRVCVSFYVSLSFQDTYSLLGK